ncbi:MAG TPA: hypothetical protein H9769_06045, partial [Candidatus Microbacterium pullistercoris]|nr:hypothetical protein [Candidatus Microbacterium pullistercoris]
MSLEEAAARIEHKLTHVLKTLSDLDVQLRALKTVDLFGSQHSDEMSQQLEGVARRALLDAEQLMVGVGAAWGDDDASSGMLWWRADAGEVSRKIHVANPSSDSYYDVEHTQWHDHALRAGGGLVVVGPYVDAWGTDDHALTPARAVFDGDNTLGVVAIDLDA